MPLFQTPTQRKFLFAALYLSEGAPIGYIWLALPTRLRGLDVPIEQITWLTAVLVLPWTFKFAWAPLIDLLHGRFWTVRDWIVAAQVLMGVTLIPLLWLDPVTQFSLMAGLLLVHAFSAATQDVSIDALCIACTTPGERGQYNGWMQTGMLLGRALMGGGALVLGQYVGDRAVIGLLIGLTTFSAGLVLLFHPAELAKEAEQRAGRLHHLRLSVVLALTDRNTWLGLLFAATAGAGYKSLEVVLGPFLVDRGYAQDRIGWFTLGPVIVAMIFGSLCGGLLADRLGQRRTVAAALVFTMTMILLLAGGDLYYREQPGLHLLVCLTAAAWGIGLFTSSAYALFMDLTRPAIAAAQFSAFMGATNACEAWSSFAAGRIIAEHGYPAALAVMSVLSLLSLPLLAFLRPPPQPSPPGGGR